MRKTCRICGVEKPVTEFHPRKDSPDGYRNDCRACNLAQQKARYERHYESRWKPTRERHYQANQERIVQERRAFRAEEGQRINARRRDLRASDPERYRRAARDYLQRHPEQQEQNRIAIRNRKRSKRRMDRESVSFVALIRRDPCAYCGCVGGTWDHIDPVKRGGTSHWSNATGACGSCNARKGTDPLLTFLLRA